MTDPEFALFHLQRALWDPVDPLLVGSLAEELRYKVNGETYRFASRRTMRRFEEAPALFCGLLRDPVSGRRFFPSVDSPRMQWAGGTYFFSSDSTRAEFVRAPRQYEVKRSF